MATFEIFGKDRLGELGFCLNAAKIKGKENGFRCNIEYIRDSVLLGNKCDLVMTSLTSCEDIERQNGSYVPTVVNYCEEYADVFNPVSMLERKIREKMLPTADFIVCDRWNGYSNYPKIMTLSRSAPIIYMEWKSGKRNLQVYCLGTLLRKPIIENGEYIFSKLIRAMTKGEGIGEEDTIYCRVVTCTDYSYPETGTIFNNIKDILAKLGVTDVELMYAVDRNKDFLYQYDDFGNHVVVVSVE